MMTLGDLEISAGFARAMLPGQPAGGAYLTIRNNGAVADRFVSAASPVAARVELHTMEVIDDVMVMRPVKDGFEIAPGQTVALQPGGKHLMFMEVSAPFREGATVPVVLTFETAGKLAIELPVRSAKGGGDHSSH